MTCSGLASQTSETGTCEHACTHPPTISSTFANTLRLSHCATQDIASHLTQDIAVQTCVALLMSALLSWSASHPRCWRCCSCWSGRCGGRCGAGSGASVSSSLLYQLELLHLRCQVVPDDTQCRPVRCGTLRHPNGENLLALPLGLGSLQVHATAALLPLPLLPLQVRATAVLVPLPLLRLP